MGKEGINYARLNREIRMQKNNGIVKYFKNEGYKFELPNYISLNNIERLELIAKTIETINSTYKLDFRDIESKKPKNKQIKLEKDFKLHDVIEATEGIPVTEKALEIFYANKIAHVCRTAQKKLLSDMITKENIENEEFETLMYDFNESEINSITLSLHRYFIAEKNMNNKATKIAKMQLTKKGIGNEQISQLKQMGYDVLAKAYINSMAVKDEAIAESIDLLKEDKDQSFGLAKIRNGKTKKEENIFVIDIPCFGQMSVHIYAPELITSLSEYKYTYPIYQTENVLLSDRASKYQESFLSKSTEELIESLKKLKSKKEAHEIAVKAGLTKEEIDIIHRKDEGDGR